MCEDERKLHTPRATENDTFDICLEVKRGGGGDASGTDTSIVYLRWCDGEADPGGAE